MIEINLLPGGARKKATSSGSSVDFGALLAGVNSKLGDKLLLGTVTIMVVMLGLGGYLYYRQTHDRTVAETRLEKAKADSSRYAKVVAARAIAEAKRDTLQRQVNLIRAIDDDRFIWPHILDEISRALPAYTWIVTVAPGGVQGAANVVAAPVLPKPSATDTSKARFKPKKLVTEVPRDNVLIRLTGRTVDVQAMTRFMTDLEASPFFSNVFNEGSRPAGDPANGEFFQFQLILNYSRPDSMALRRVPYTTARR
jgi:Tfp pilus assembly protein PilN